MQAVIQWRVCSPLACQPLSCVSHARALVSKSCLLHIAQACILALPHFSMSLNADSGRIPVFSSLFRLSQSTSAPSYFFGAPPPSSILTITHSCHLSRTQNPFLRITFGAPPPCRQLVGSFIQTQKFSVQKALERRFRVFLTHGSDYHQLLMSLLQVGFARGACNVWIVTCRDLGLCA